jgi:tetratricopeptide (TPR) repeat protein
VVLLLEDLQWAQSESLRLLASLVPLTSTLPLLIFGTYRDDERPHLLDGLPGMRSMRLGRLSPEAMAELGESMMGAPGRRPEVGALLARETEGNAFFLVEVVRALAEEAGGLERVGTGLLPERVFTGGVQRAVQRRLEQVPEPARPLLQLAAVLGRVLSLEVLQVLAPGEDLGTWLLGCSEAAVLEPWEQGWRFAHDKLREGLLSRLEPELRRSLHRRGAVALEQVSPGQPAALAFHWSAAGEPSREAHWSLRAAEQSFRSGAYPEARTLLERVATLQEQLDVPRVERASVQRKLGEVSMQLNEHAAAIRHLLASARLLGQELPTSTAGWAVSALWNLMLQFLQLARPGVFAERNPQRRQELLEAAWLLYPLWKMQAAQGDSPLKVVGLILVSAVLADRARQPYAVALASLGYMFSIARLPRLATLYFERASGALGGRRNLDFPTLVFAEASHLLHHGNFQRALVLLEEGRAVADAWGDQNSGEVLRHMQAECEYWAGRYERALHHEQRVRQRLGFSSIAFAASEAMMLCLLGRLDMALACLEQLTRYEGEGQPVPDAILHAGKALVFARRGEMEPSIEAAHQALRRLTSKRLLLTPLAWGIPGELLLGGILEPLLAGWSHASAAGQQGQAARLKTQVRRALALARYWGRTHCLGRPRVLLYQGQAEQLQGHGRKALRLWQQSLRLAEQLALPLPQALARLELGHHPLLAPQEREAHLQRARELLLACGASHPLQPQGGARAP